MTKELAQRIRALKNMDKVIRMVNDEDNGVFVSWMEMGIPDGATFEDFREYAEDDEIFAVCCERFARLIANLIAEGDFTKEWYSLELTNFNHELYN